MCINPYSQRPQQKQQKKSRVIIIMWLIGGLCSMLALLLVILSSSSSSSTDEHAAAIADRQKRHSALSQAAKAMKKITKSGIKLIDKKNIARGADGTVIKDLDRGSPLKAHLDEDADEGYTDDFWYEGEEDKTFEEKELEKQAQEREETKTAANDNNVVDGGEKKDDSATGAADESSTEENKEKDSSEQTTTATEATQPQQPDAATPTTTTTTTTTTKPKKKIVPRVWESNAIAVMKIHDKDAHPDIEVTSNGKLIHKPNETNKTQKHSHKHMRKDHNKGYDEEEEGSSEDSEDDSEDSSDDEEEDPEGYDEKKATHLPLPNLGKLKPDEAVHTLLSSTSGLTTTLQKRMSKMFESATSHSCRVKIAEHMALFVNGLAEETKFPFEDFYYPNTCEAIPRYSDWENLPPGTNLQDIQYRTYQPSRLDVPVGTYIDNVEELQLVYVILTHDQPEAAIRLIESVYVPGVTKYVIHVDGKEKADPTYHRLVEYAKELNAKASAENGDEQEIMRIVPNSKRVRVNWGGFTMVQATLHALHTLFGLDYYHAHPGVEGGDDPNNPHAFTFHKLVHLASTTYPLASNTEIRDTFASYPLDANFLHIILRPNNPTPSVWNYFVECDDALHRIYRIPALNADRGNGVDIYTSSQWFIISHEFAWYLAKPPKESFVEYYLEYIEHVVVADEAFFGTVIRNTHFCSTLHNDNFLHLQFDRWENEAVGPRDQRKCVMKNRNHCGRSPTTITVDYLPVLELSGDLFARKFDDVVEPVVKDYIDKRREKEEERLHREAELMKEYKKNGTEVPELPLEEWEFQGEGVLIVAKETINDEVPLCMGLADTGNQVQLRPCFKDDVPPSLSEKWEEGAVIIEELNGYNRWDIGPCSSDGELKRNATGELEMIPGIWSEKGPSCGIKIGDGARMGRCMDVESETFTPGGKLNIFPCYTKWHQLFSFGNGTIAPRGAIHSSLPLHMARQLQKKDDKNQVHQHLCIGVVGRGDLEETWVEWDSEDEEHWDPWEYDQHDVDRYDNGRKSLQLWSGQHLQTTPCSNKGGVLEFYFVPFIVEEYDDEESTEGATEASNTEDDEEL